MWLLWQFETSDGLTVTRARTQKEAEFFLINVAKCQNVKSVDTTWIDAAWLYSRNHPFNWCDSPPRWISMDHTWLPPDPNFKLKFHPPLKRGAKVA